MKTALGATVTDFLLDHGHTMPEIFIASTYAPVTLKKLIKLYKAIIDYGYPFEDRSSDPYIKALEFKALQCKIKLGWVDAPVPGQMDLKL
jgi:hypothetical protein